MTTKLRILGKTWELRFLPEEEMGTKLGCCDSPSTRRKSIDILATIGPEDLLDTLVHECMHAAGFHVLGEYFCDKVGTDIAAAILTPEVVKRLVQAPQFQEALHAVAASRTAPALGSDHEDAVQGTP